MVACTREKVYKELSLKTLKIRIWITILSDVYKIMSKKEVHIFMNCYFLYNDLTPNSSGECEILNLFLRYKTNHATDPRP